MKVNVHGGHNKIVPGASKYLNEVTEDRKVKNELVSILKKEKVTVYDCTDDKGKTQSNNLKNIVSKCNSHKVNYDVSIHLNAGGGEGVEVLIYSSKLEVTAKRICKEISSLLGIKNRGVKVRKDLYVLKHANSPALLIECCFVDSKKDKEKWNYKKCALGIAQGLLNKKLNTKVKEKENTKKKEENSFLIKVSNVKANDVLNIREKPSSASKKVGFLKSNDPNTYTIIDTQKSNNETWGKLKSGKGWINLKYTKKV